VKTSISALIVGFIFAIGLGLSGMTNPKNVVSFLDVFGDWNPSLVFVMGGALLVHMVFFRVITKRASPLFASQFQIPNRRDIDKRLIVGSMLFGIGWGLAGYCPAPAITSLASFTAPPIIFVLSMLVGMSLFTLIDKRTSKKTAR
jgi:uncharacterized protein